jgi:glycosyltransferase involved in cell wall biosynthesis
MRENHKRFHILYLHDVVQIGGAERSLFYLIKNLDREKFIPILVVPSEGPFTDDLKSLGVEIHFIDFPKPCNPNLLKKIKTISKLITVVRNKNIDLIHSNGFRTNLYGGIAGRLIEKKIVWHARNLITSEKIDPDRLFIFLTHKIICLTEAVQKRFYRGRTPLIKSIVIQNGVDVKEFNSGISGISVRKEFGIPKEAPIIGITSRIVPIKGHDTFLRAARIVTEDFSDARFLIVGSHLSAEYNGWEEHIRKFAAEIGLSERVIFTSFRRDLPKILAAMDIFVLASYSEASGRATLEAMAMARPIVATRYGGTAEIVIDGESAILVEPSNDKAMADAIISLLKNPERRIELGKKAKERVQELFSIERNVRKTEKVYLNLLIPKVKVLHVIHSSELSGPQRHLLDIVKSIDKDRFSVEVACPEGWLSKELEKNNVKIHRIELKDGFSINSFLFLYRITKKGDYDIIHAHMGRTGLYAKLVGVVMGKPVILTEHLVAHDHLWIKNPLKRRLHLMGHKLSNRMAKIIIAVSGVTRDAYIERQGVSSDKIIIMYNFVDTDIVASEDDVLKVRHEFGINKDDFVVGFVGRLDWRKGLKTIVDAAEGLKRVKFLIVGDGDARDDLKAEIKRKGIDKDFILTGLRKDVPALMKAMDIFVFPTTAPYESFGIVVIEAMAACIPVIASDIGPLREIINDGETGILIPPKNRQALRSAIERLMRDKDLMKKLADNGTKTVHERFSLKKRIIEIEEVYERILAR